MTLVQYESVALERDEASHNRRWQINDAGELFYHRNQAGCVRPDEAEVYWFDAPSPSQPTRVLSPAQMDTLRAHLRTFADWPAQTRRDCQDTEHGGWDRLRLSCGERTIEIELHSRYQNEMKALISPIQALWLDA